MNAPIRSSIALSALAIFLLSLLSMAIVPPANALTTVRSNSLSVKLNADGCSTSEGGTTCGLTCSASCEGQSENRVEVAINQCVAGIPFGSRVVTGDLYATFIIESDKTPPGNYVSAQMSYDIWWKGTWCMAAVFEEYRTMRANVWLDVVEVSTGKRV